MPVQISHMKALGSQVWGKSTKALSMVRSAKRAGVDVMVDQYPYAATSSTLLVMFPQWSQEGGIAALLERLADREQEEKIRAAFDRTLAMRGGGPRMTLSEYAPDHSLEGRTLSEVAKRQRTTEFDAAVDLLRASQGHVSMIYHTLETVDIERIFKQRYVMVASDGSAVAPYGKLAADYYPHPRNYGCFPRVLGDFVRKKRLVKLEEAVRKMTSLPAARFGLEERGMLKRGWRADVTVFDPRTVADRATFEKPREYPVGIAFVFVNGAMVLERGEHTGKRPGRVLFSQNGDR